MVSHSHPMHLHGFNMYILHEGLGPWDGTIIHPENPQRRDVFQVRGKGHLVMQFDAADNPGKPALLRALSHPWCVGVTDVTVQECGRSTAI